MPVLPKARWAGREFGKTTLEPPLGSGRTESALPVARFPEPVDDREQCHPGEQDEQSDQHDENHALRIAEGLWARPARQHGYES